MSTCALALNAIIVGLCTYFWLWYLTSEAERYSSKTVQQPNKWYERPITEIFERLLKKIRRTMGW
jgi:hypothetical protein